MSDAHPSSSNDVADAASAAPAAPAVAPPDTSSAPSVPTASTSSEQKQSRATSSIAAARRLFGALASAASSSSGSNPVSVTLPQTTATASHADIVDPAVLVSQWRIPSLLDHCINTLASSILSVPSEAIADIPPELLLLLCRTLSRTRQWSDDVWQRLAPHIQSAAVDELDLAQWDGLTSQKLEQACQAIKHPILSINLARSYHLDDIDALVRAGKKDGEKESAQETDGSSSSTSASSSSSTETTPSPSHLSQLHTLDLDRCRRLKSPSVNPVLALCPALRTLRLSGTRINEATLVALSSSQRRPKNLTELDMSGWNLSDGLQGIATCGMPLADLRLTGTGFPAAQIASLSALSRTLHTLHLQFMPHMNDASLAGIGECQQLTHLDLSRNSNLSDEGFAHLSKLTKLKHLNLSRTDLTPASTGVLRQFTKLTHLDVSFNSSIDDGMLLELCPILTSMRVLILSYCSSITDRAFVDGVAKHLYQLQVVKFNGTKAGDAFLERMMEMCIDTEPIVIQRDEEDDQKEETRPDLSPSNDGASGPSVSSSASFDSSLPHFRFPHSLLCFDFGSNASTDASINSLAQLLPRLPALQRVGIWNSSISTYKLKVSMAGWEMDVYRNAVADKAEPALDETDSDSGQAPPPPARIVSHWYLDESMKTAPGTFLLVRRSELPPSLTTSATWPGPIRGNSTHGAHAYSYGLDEFVHRLAARHSPMTRATKNGRRVTFSDELIFFPPMPTEFDDSEVEEEEEEEEFDSVIRMDDSEDEDDGLPASAASNEDGDEDEDDDDNEDPPSVIILDGSG